MFLLLVALLAFLGFILWASTRDLIAALRRQDLHTAFWLLLIASGSSGCCLYLITSLLLMIGGGR